MAAMPYVAKQSMDTRFLMRYREGDEAAFQELFSRYRKVLYTLLWRYLGRHDLVEDVLQEEGTTTMPFDIMVLNDLDRFHLAGDVIDRVPDLGSRAAYSKQVFHDALLDHKTYIHKNDQDIPEVCNWKLSRSETQDVKHEK